MAPRLCEYCAQIPFACLAMPTASEIRKARAAVKAGQTRRPIRLPYREQLGAGDKVDAASHVDVDRPVDLGTLGRVRESAGSRRHPQQGGCALCRLFLGVVERQGQRYVNDWPIPEDDDNVHLRAGTAHYGTVWETLTGARRELYYITQRLELAVHFVRDTEVRGTLIPADYPLALYSAVAQACNVDDGEFGIGGTTTRRPAGEEEELGQQDGDGGCEEEDVAQEWEEIDDGRMLFCARKRPDVLDFNLVKSWIRLCQEEHRNICHTDDETAGRGTCTVPTPNDTQRKCIRFIDVDRDCLTTLHDVDLASTHYAALSYVWGNYQNVVKLTQDNKEAFHGPGSLSREGLPQTIKDSIEVARRLGFQWLWIDALCIFQDRTEESDRDRAYQLASMGMIYSCAFITIIGACGRGAEDGLWGLRPGSREFHQEAVEVIPGKLGLVATCSSRQVWTQKSHPMSAELRREDVDASTWSTRAWTYQERSLSRRCLVFAEGQVFWACDGGIFCEESHFEHPDILKGLEPSENDGPLRMDLADTTGGRGALAFKTIDGMLAKRWTTSRQFWQRYARDVETYSSRHLTMDADVYDAFRSALEAYTRLSGEEFLWGHPKSQIGLSLLWQPTRNSNLHRREVELKSGKVGPYLPSWAWMGWVGAVELTLGEEKLESVIPEVLCFAHESQPGSTAPRIVMVHAINRFDGAERAEDSPYLPRKSWFSDESLDVSWGDVEQQLPGLTAEKLGRTADGHVLLFWASSVVLQVRRDTGKRRYVGVHSSSHPAEIVDGDGQRVGVIERMGPWQQAASLAGRHEFIALGRQDLGIDELREQYPPKVMAMQVRWEDGVAHRENLAEVDQAAWAAAQPTWKLVALM